MSIRHKPRRAKRYRPRAVHHPMLIGAELALRPLEMIIDQIERDGTVTTMEGRAVFQDGDGTWYRSAEAVEGLLIHLEMYCTRHGRTLPLDPIRALAAALRELAPVDDALLAALIAGRAAIRRAMSLADPGDQVDLLRQTQIKVAMEATAAC